MWKKIASRAAAPVRFPRHWLDYLCLCVGLLAVATCLRVGLLQDLWNVSPDNFSRRIAHIAQMMNGEAFLGDLTQDILGFRGLWEKKDPYPVFGPAGGNAQSQSAHPPTAFLFAGPVAFVPLATAARIWLSICIALLFFSALCYGLRWPAALGLALSLGILWGPIASSFHQITLIWLAGVAMAYRYRFHRALWAGAGIGIASLTKLLPLGILGYFLFARKFRAAVGLLAVWLIAVAIVFCLNPGAFAGYMEMNRQNILAQILRLDNISVWTQSYALLGGLGIALTLAWIVLLAWRNCRELFAPANAPDYSFFLYSFLAVMLLPICWSYSLVPLLPVFGYFIVRGRAVHRVIAGSCLLALAVLNPFEFSHRNLPMSGVLLLSSVLFCLRPPAEASGTAGNAGEMRSGE